MSTTQYCGNIFGNCKVGQVFVIAGTTQYTAER